MAKTKEENKIFFTRTLIFVEISHKNDIIYPEKTTYNNQMIVV